MIITFHTMRRRRKMYTDHGRMSVCFCVCLSSYAFFHYCTYSYFNVTLGNGWRYPLVVHIEIIFKSVHRLCCYCNIQKHELKMLASSRTCCIVYNIIMHTISKELLCNLKNCRNGNYIGHMPFLVPSWVLKHKSKWTNWLLCHTIMLFDKVTTWRKCAQCTVNYYFQFYLISLFCRQSTPGWLPKKKHCNTCPCVYSVLWYCWLSNRKCILPLKTIPAIPLVFLYVTPRMHMLYVSCKDDQLECQARRSWPPVFRQVVTLAGLAEWLTVWCLWHWQLSCHWTAW